MRTFPTINFEIEMSGLPAGWVIDRDQKSLPFLILDMIAKKTSIFAQTASGLSDLSNPKSTKANF